MGADPLHSQRSTAWTSAFERCRFHQDCSRQAKALANFSAGPISNKLR